MLYAYSMLSSMVTSLIMGIIFLFLSKQSGKIYMGYWGVCWLISSVVFFLDFFNIENPDLIRNYLALRQALLVTESWIFLKSTHRFFQVKKNPIINKIFYLILILSLSSILIDDLLIFILVPCIITTSSFLIASGCMFISYSWTQHLPEKLAASFLILLRAFFINHFGFTISHNYIALATYYTSMVTLTVLMLFLMILHFKKVHFIDNKQAALFRLLVENSYDSIFLFDYKKKTFDYLSADVSRIIGVTTKDLYDNHQLFFTNLKPDKTNKDILKIFSKPVTQSDNLTIAFEKKGKEKIWAELHYIPILDNTGKTKAIEGIVRDITRRKQAEQRLQKNEKVKKDFIENITHEIRTPITLISGYAESVVNDTVPKSASKVYMNMILSKAHTLNNLLDDLKQLTDFSSQDVDFKFYEHDAKSFFQDLANQCHYHVEQSIRSFSSSIDLNDDMIVIIDENRIMQVATNLINNAIKHTPINNEIKFECFAEKTSISESDRGVIPGGNIVFSILDSGSGILDEDLPHLFKRGYRGKEPSILHEDYSTPGLGLYISKQLINQHSGSISAGNNELGGAIFTVKIPYYNK